MKKYLLLGLLALSANASAGLITYNFIEDGNIGNTVSRDTKINNLLSFGVIGRRGVKVDLYEQFDGGGSTPKWYTGTKYLMDSHRKTYAVNDNFTFYFNIRELFGESVMYTSNDFSSYQLADNAVRFNITNDYFNGYVDVSNVVQSASIDVPEPSTTILFGLGAIGMLAARKKLTPKK